MKKKIKQFVQHLDHDIEADDGILAWNYLEKSLSKIGFIVMYFNGLEKLLDGILCETFSDRSDTPGLIVLQNMPYTAKVNLFSRFSDELHRAAGEVPGPYVGLVEKLKNSAKQRNIVVHADWENTDKEGYTYSNIRFSDGGMEQEYIQLTAASLDLVQELILSARVRLAQYHEAKSELMR